MIKIIIIGYERMRYVFGSMHSLSFITNIFILVHFDSYYDIGHFQRFVALVRTVIHSVKLFIYMNLLFFFFTNRQRSHVAYRTYFFVRRKFILPFSIDWSCVNSWGIPPASLNWTLIPMTVCRVCNTIYNLCYVLITFTDRLVHMNYEWKRWPMPMFWIFRITQKKALTSYQRLGQHSIYDAMLFFVLIIEIPADDAVSFLPVFIRKCIRFHYSIYLLFSLSLALSLAVLIRCAYNFKRPLCIEADQIVCYCILIARQLTQTDFDSMNVLREQKVLR